MGLEAAMRQAAKWAAVWTLVSATLVFVEAADDLVWASVVHLSGLVVFALLLTARLAPAADGRHLRGSPGHLGSLGAGAAVVAMVSGAVLLVTLVSSAALGFEVSLQFLQLLSALDIAWVVAAVYVGLRRQWGTTAASVAGTATATICIWSIWRYLDQVGFTDTGGWLVDIEALSRLVLPLDVIAAVMAVGILVWSSRQATVQRKPQSYD